MINVNSVTLPLGTATGLAFVLGALAFSMVGARSTESAVVVPAPAVAEAEKSAAHNEKIVVAGGCFWGVQAVFQHVKGVKAAVSGYAGGDKDTATYTQVSGGQTDHAEAVEITFDPHVVSFTTILQIYFSVAHNPTQLNHQGPDHGAQYRSEIFYESEEQKRVAVAYMAQLESAKVFDAPIVTRVEPLNEFFPAEAYHQNYATLNPDSIYIVYNDAPKVENLRKLFPKYFQLKPRLVGLVGLD